VEDVKSANSGADIPQPTISDKTKHPLLHQKLMTHENANHGSA
jgi:hypothetical protein